MSYLSGALPQGRIGLGPASLAALRAVPAADRARLDLAAVDRAFTSIAGITGKGAQGRREAVLAGGLAS